VLTLSIPLRTVSGLNAREHPMMRSRRVKKERHATAWMLAGKKPPALPVTVTMTRLGPTSGLDRGDNLNASMKGCRDQIAQWLGVDDRSDLVEWRYAQRREKQWSVLVEVAPCA
jgi:hypothetical protein